MNFEIIKANPETESKELSAMQVAVLPNEKPFPLTVWTEEKIETWWIKVDGEKVGIISIERDSAPGENYESESWDCRGAIYLILIGLIPNYQKKGLGRLAMEWLKMMVRSMRGYSSIVSNIRVTNCASMNLHTSAGFKMIGVRNEYFYNPTCDSPVFELKI